MRVDLFTNGKNVRVALTDEQTQTVFQKTMTIGEWSKLVSAPKELIIVKDAGAAK